MTQPKAPLLAENEKRDIAPALLEPIEYRKSGLSLNHIIGCPLDCAYCVRHLFHNYEMKQPHRITDDETAASMLVSHKYFQPNITPLQIFNRATDPFLPTVKPHLFRVAELLDQRGLTNHLLIITRSRVSIDDCNRLNAIKNLKITLLVTYSGIDDKRVEPIDSNIAIKALTRAHEMAENYRVVLYWRPLVSGLNDSPSHIKRALQLSTHAHATVFTGLFFREEIQSYYRKMGLPEPANLPARRKILVRSLEDRILTEWHKTGRGPPLFRKTSCAVSFAHRLSDYNGHYGIRELCDICPVDQIRRCADAFRKPEAQAIADLALSLGASAIPTIDDRAIQTSGLNEEPRYFMQHTFGYQVHDIRHPHLPHRHGRAEIGWTDEPESRTSSSED
ncbi:hypothetical protein LZ198_37110 [Myxococcus sp. K15C18031901]|uniref:hypothetical protein n=1 Tax=Myxococcus dinghuensis TaxID=2906761 RepID=UPI0020A7F0EA|nr:hypothetical protein [Myxococcus dinghuensis]MCP3104497.1 hypothetical protein [Myxococcus dinghuensis]